jgi:hypothetical protein
MNPILAVPAAALGALALAPRAVELVTAPVDFLATLREAVGSDEKSQDTQKSLAITETETETPRTLRRKLEAALDNLHRQLTVKLAAEGIDTTRPFQAEWNGRGKLRVHGDHPDADKIRRLLADDRSLAQAAAEIGRLAKRVGESKDSRDRLSLSYSPHGVSVV